MRFDISALTKTMTEALRGAAGKRWSSIRGVMAVELKALAEKLEEVNQLYSSGKIDAERAKELVSMQVNVARGVLESGKGLGLLAGREAITAITRAAGEVVNGLVGFKLISQEQESARETPTGSTKETKAVRPGSSTKPTQRTVKAQFKAGKDL